MDRETRIRERAYDLWEQAGRPHGREQEHWAEAAREVDADEQGDDPVAADSLPNGGEDARRTASANIDALTAEEATRATLEPGTGAPGGEPESAGRRPL